MEGKTLGHLNKNKSFLEPSDKHCEREKNLKLGSYKLKIIVKNKPGILAILSTLLSKRGAYIKELDYNSSNTKESYASLELRLEVRKGQLAGILNDSKRIPQVKKIITESITEGH